MQNFDWQLDNFALGMHTEPTKTKCGERYAADIENVGPDGNNITFGRFFPFEGN